MELQKDYSFIRGFCYSSAYRAPEEKLRREFGYAKSLRLNSTRIWLSFREYRADPEGFLQKLKLFSDVAWEYGISVMPILFNGNMMDPEILKPASWAEEDEYEAAVVNLLKDHPGLIMWDIMNEPSCNAYMDTAPSPEERERRWEEMTLFLRHHCAHVKALAPDNVRTIGHTVVRDVDSTLDSVEVVSFHDYRGTRARIEASYSRAEEIIRETGKPVINSELCCLARSNPYDLALGICEEHRMGWYLFELMIEGYWSDIHGIFYPDGTVRDPSIPAAVLGFHRNRTDTAVHANANKEGAADRGIAMVRKALAHKNADSFHIEDHSLDAVLEAAEYCANLLEACELVPMNVPPTEKIARIRRTGDMDAARKLAFELAEILKKECMLL